MNGLASRGLIAWRWRIPLIAVVIIAVAVGLICLIALATLPLLGHVSANGFLPAIALVAALPIFLIPAWTSYRTHEQKRDLAAREELFTTAQRIGKLGYWHYDLEIDRVFLSDNVHDLLGDPCRTLRMSLRDLLQRTSPADRGRMRQALTGLVEDGSSEHDEYRITGLDGVEKTFWIEGRRMRDAVGRSGKIYGACQDITERRQIEAALRESEDHYRHAVELNPQIPWTADARGNVLEMGPAWLTYIGEDRAEALGTGWTAALHPDDLAPTLQRWSEALVTGAPIENLYRLRQSGGAYRWFRARAAARRNDAGDIIRWYGTIEDVHDQWTAHAALRESEAFARSILDSTPDSVQVLDLDGHVQFMNEPGLKRLEIDDFSQFQSGYWPTLWPDADRADILDAMDAARDGRTGRFFSFCPTQNGVSKWWDVTISPVLGSDGKPDRLLAISRDMSAEKRAQDEVERARTQAEDAARRLQNVLSSTTDCVVTLNRDMRFTFMNAQAKRLIARGRDLVGMTHAEAFPQGGRNSFVRDCEAALSNRVPVPFEGNLAPHDVWFGGCIYPTPDGLSVFLKDLTESRRAQEQLLYLAHHDPLTGLVNRTILQERLDRSLAASSTDRQTALLFLDLDEFKGVNDSMGHTAGDRVLVQVAERLRASVRNCDTVARFGGDEFAIIAVVNDQQEASALANRIIDDFKPAFLLDGRTVNIGTSVGLVMVSEPGARADDVLRDADIALYRAKAEGRGICRMFDPEMGELNQERQELKQDLKHAAQRGEMFVEYQPLVDLATSRITGFEALLRWHHPTRGPISPATFIPIAEEAGTILEIGEWVLAQACKEAASWPCDLLVAVNLSPVQFRSGNLVETVERCLSDAALPARRIQLEITETVLLVDSDANLKALHALHQLGVSISMDDFGTGYSSLRYLRSFPVDKIKIDQAFVSDLSRDRDKNGEPQAIVRAIVELARGFGIRTTAEGVETADQARALREMGCDEGQGYLYSKPVVPSRIPALISRLNDTRETMSCSAQPTLQLLD